MDMKTFKNCKQVSKSWQEFIDNQNILWKSETGANAFQLACLNGHSKMAGILIKNSKKFNINLNAKSGRMGKTAFHNACIRNNLKIAEMLMQKSTEFDIDLNIKMNNGDTAFHYACINGTLWVKSGVWW